MTVIRWVLLLVAALVVLDAAGLALMVLVRRWHEQGRVRPARSGRPQQHSHPVRLAPWGATPEFDEVP